MSAEKFRKCKETSYSNDKRERIVPPDGGWGWMVVASYALNNIIMIPLILGLGLIFKDLFPMLGFTKKEEALLMSTNMGFGMAMGLTHGPLIKFFGYRKVAISGSTLFTCGLLLTAFSNNFIHFMITYGLLTSFGISLTMSSNTVAINSYFTKNRGKAVAIASVLTGVGPIIMPQFIRLLMENYTNQGTIFILSALTLHCFLASLLLQPVEWHAKVYNTDSDNDEGTVESLDNFRSGNYGMIGNRSIPAGTSSMKDLSKKTQESVESKEEIKSLTDSYRPKTHNECNKQKIESVNKSQTLTGRFNSLWLQTVEVFDLRLLSDPIYVNIMLGTSIAMFAETTFAIFIPFILKDLKFDNFEISIIMTTMAAIDLPMRGVGPSIGKWFKISPRVMYLLSLTVLVASRTSLLFCRDFKSVILTAVALGFARGLRSVFMSLIVPNYVPIERLAHATGIQMVMNAISLFCFGPIIGIMRENSGSYNPCIIFLNIMSMLTIIMWSIEILMVNRIQQKKVQQKYKGVVEDREE